MKRILRQKMLLYFIWKGIKFVKMQAKIIMIKKNITRGNIFSSPWVGVRHSAPTPGKTRVFLGSGVDGLGHYEAPDQKITSALCELNSNIFIRNNTVMG